MRFSLPAGPPAEPPPELLRAPRGSYIALSLLTAAMLNLLALPDLIARVKPDFVALLILYWTLYNPYRLGYTVVWMLGLIMDVAGGAWFGQHALSFTLLLYLGAVFQRRIIMFPLVYQVFHVGALLLSTQIVTLALRTMAGHEFPGLTYFLPSLIGASLWPVLITLLRAPLRQSPEQESV